MRQWRHSKLFKTFSHIPLLLVTVSLLPIQEVHKQEDGPRTDAVADTQISEEIKDPSPQRNEASGMSNQSGLAIKDNPEFKKYFQMKKVKKTISSSLSSGSSFALFLSWNRWVCRS